MPASFRSRVSATVGIRVAPLPESTALSSPKARWSARPGQNVAGGQALGAVLPRGCSQEGCCAEVLPVGQSEVIQREANQLSL
jgi:hypothetical protein